VYQPDVAYSKSMIATAKPLACFSAIIMPPVKARRRLMNAYVSKAVCSRPNRWSRIISTIPKPPPGEPTCSLTIEVRTAFTNSVTPPRECFEREISRFSGTSVPAIASSTHRSERDVGDLAEVLKNFAKHYKTGEPMPQALLDKVEAAEKINQGYKTTEYLSASLARSGVAPTRSVANSDGCNRV